MSSEEEIVRFTITARRIDERFGIRRRCVDLNLRRTTRNSILHGSGQLQENPVSDLRFDLPDPFSAADIFRVLLQSGVEASYCPVLASAIEDAVENLLQLGIQWFYLMVDAQIMYESERRGGASEEEMKTLQRIKGGDLKRDDECSICLEGLSDSGASHREDEIIKMPCSHLFHQPCIFTWLHTKNSCPLCRQVPFP